MMTRLICVLVGLCTVQLSAAEVDSDSDGLSDYQELHKYFTDPRKRDSDSDGTPDGDWHERREFTYTVRTVVKVMRPCNTEVVNDDYQDARVLSETKTYVELEVIHYPFNSNARAINGLEQWQERAKTQRAFTKPGITTNWDQQMREDLIAGLREDGIDLDRLTDKEAVASVATWLLARGKYQYKFGTYFMDFPDGKARILPGLEDAFQREQGNTDLPFEEHLQCEVFGKGMFYNKRYGTCTSTAIYLTTGLRAAGIPTRMILAIPVVDGSDPRQIRMIEDNITHHKIRQTLLAGIPRSGFAAHTFNEVHIGGRWVRLNYQTLGQNSFGSGAMGMLTHVHSFNDLSEAGLTETWGWRYGRGLTDETFRSSNPYRATEISDSFGKYCKLDNPPVREPTVARITKIYWFFSDQRPKWVSADSVQSRDDGHILAHVDVPFKDLKTLYPKLAKEFPLIADGKPRIRARAERGYWSQECYLRIPAAEFAKLERGVPYKLSPVQGDSRYRWEVANEVRITRSD